MGSSLKKRTPKDHAYIDEKIILSQLLASLEQAKLNNKAALPKKAR